MIQGGADVTITETKCRINITHWNTQNHLSHTPVRGKTVFHETGVPKRLGTTALESVTCKHFTKLPTLNIGKVKRRNVIQNTRREENDREKPNLDKIYKGMKKTTDFANEKAARKIDKEESTTKLCLEKLPNC